MEPGTRLRRAGSLFYLRHPRRRESQRGGRGIEPEMELPRAGRRFFGILPPRASSPFFPLLPAPPAMLEGQVAGLERGVTLVEPRLVVALAFATARVAVGCGGLQALDLGRLHVSSIRLHRKRPHPVRGRGSICCAKDSLLTRQRLSTVAQTSMGAQWTRTRPAGKSGSSTAERQEPGFLRRPPTLAAVLELDARMFVCSREGVEAEVHSSGEPGR